MTAVRIIGIGSDHAPDNAGWLAIEQLQRADFSARFAPGQVSLLVCRFPAQLMYLLQGSQLALLIDAVPAAPGTVLEVDPARLVTARALHSSHGIGVGEALKLVSQLHAQAPLTRLLGIGVADVDVHGMDRLVRQAGARIRLFLESAIENFYNTERQLPAPGDTIQVIQ